MTAPALASIVTLAGALLGASAPQPAGSPDGVMPVIYRGEEITGNAAAASVSIRVTTTAGTLSYCTGTLIAPRLVLTAAHCFVKAGDAPAEIFNSPLATLPSATVIARRGHPNYQKTDDPSGKDYKAIYNFGRDVSLLLLDQPPEGKVPAVMADERFSAETWQGGATWSVHGTARDESLTVMDAFAGAISENVMLSSPPRLFSARLGQDQGWCVRDSGGGVFVTLDDGSGEERAYLVGVAVGSIGAKIMPGIGERQATRTWGDLGSVPHCAWRYLFVGVNEPARWFNEAVEALSSEAGEPLRIERGRFGE